MNLKAVVIEQLEDDGYLKTFKMYADPGRDITVAFADEYEDEDESTRSGPFHFLDEDHGREFEKGIGECKAWKLPKSRFYLIRDEGVFKHSWAGIPTERSSLSYYALSLPKFAVPTKVEFKDPHSGRIYSNKITRDDRRNRIALYLECRSSRGLFDFSLHVSFRIDRSDFRDYTSSEEHNRQDDPEISSYEQMLMPDEKRAVVQFFAQKLGVLQISPDPSGHQFELVPPAQSKMIPQRATSPETKSNAPEKLLAKKNNLSRYLSLEAVELTDIQREVISLRLEHALPVAEIARRLGKNRKTIQEHLLAAQRRIEHARGFEGRAAKRSTDDSE